MEGGAEREQHVGSLAGSCTEAQKVLSPYTTSSGPDWAVPWLLTSRDPEVTSNPAHPRPHCPHCLLQPGRPALASARTPLVLQTCTPTSAFTGLCSRPPLAPHLRSPC